MEGGREGGGDKGGARGKVIEEGESNGWRKERWKKTSNSVGKKIRKEEWVFRLSKKKARDKRK